MLLNKSDSNIEEIVSILRKGGVAVIPTDTVYGFSACTDISETDLKIRKIKGRAETKPFIQLISKPEDIFLYTNDIIPQKLLSFWPGPLTIICNDKREEGVTTAFRCPGDLWLRKIIEKCGCPLYSTSVNRSGSPVLGKICEIQEEFEEEVNLIVSDGDSSSSVPSTIVKIENGKTVILREGAVPSEKLF